MNQDDEMYRQRSNQMFATSLANGLQVLGAFRYPNPELSHGDLVRRCRLSKSTVSRLTHTLCEKGFLQYDFETRRYRLGMRLLTISNPLMLKMSIRQAARPLMQQLADSVGGSASLGMRDRGCMVYIETIRRHESSSFRPDIGGVIPIWDTAMGRAWIAAHLGDSDPGTWFEMLDRAGIYNGDVHMQILEGAMREYLQYGFCCSRGSWIPTVYGVAVPMQLRLDREILVFNVGMPTDRIGADALEKRIGPKLKQMVHHLQEITEPWTRANI